MALLLTRRYNEKIRITTPSGEEVWIWPIMQKRSSMEVKFAIHAARNIEIVREELLPPGEHLPGPAHE